MNPESASYMLNQVEYALNDGWSPDPLPRAIHRRAFERLLRRLLAFPRRPAVTLLMIHNFENECAPLRVSENLSAQPKRSGCRRQCQSTLITQPVRPILVHTLMLSACSPFGQRPYSWFRPRWITTWASLCSTTHWRTSSGGQENNNKIIRSSVYICLYV